ncbi:hypothetical protein VTH82DRAFT_2042 [Thermothelomyces myriococcoides]
MRCHLVQDLVPQQDVAKDKESGAAHALYRPLCRISSAPHAAETVRQPMKVDGRHSRRQMGQACSAIGIQPLSLTVVFEAPLTKARSDSAGQRPRLA